MFCTVCEFTVNNAVNVTQKLKATEILLDNQVDISIIHPVLLDNVHPAEQEIKIKVVGGIQMRVYQVGDLPGFFQVYASAEKKANVISFADVEDLYEISYVQKEAFVVHMPSGDLVFSRQEKLYVAKLYEVGEKVVQATVRENEALYTKAEVKRAKKAYEVLKNSRYIWATPRVGTGKTDEEHCWENAGRSNAPECVKDTQDVHGRYAR